MLAFFPDGRMEGGGGTGGDPGESSRMNNGCRILGDHVQTLIMDWAQLGEGSEVTTAKSLPEERRAAQQHRRRRELRGVVV